MRSHQAAAQMTVQFSGGEPTISPIFLDAVRYARKVGYFSVQAAPTASGSRRTRLRRQTRDAGMRIAYLQFDGVSEEANAHRKVGNLFDVKLRAIENLYAASGGGSMSGLKSVVESARNIVNTARRSSRADRQVRVANCDKVSFVSVPAGIVFHRPRRRHQRPGAAREALHALRISRKTCAGRPASSEPLRRLVPLSAIERSCRTSRTSSAVRGRIGAR